MDVVFGHQGIGSCQIEKIVVPGLRALELVFRVLGLSLGRKMERKSHHCRMQNGFLMYSRNRYYTNLIYSFIISQYV